MRGSTRLNQSAGQIAAENLDLRLRLVETRERMTAVCLDHFTAPQSGVPTPQYDHRQIDPLESRRNLRILYEHLDVCRALASSLSWRVVDFVSTSFDRTLRNPAAASSEGGIETISDPAEIRRRLDEAAEYLTRVLGSRRWRLLQDVRGVFGRRW